MCSPKSNLKSAWSPHEIACTGHRPSPVQRVVGRRCPDTPPDHGAALWRPGQLRRAVTGGELGRRDLQRSSNPPLGWRFGSIEGHAQPRRREPDRGAVFPRRRTPRRRRLARKSARLEFFGGAPARVQIPCKDRRPRLCPQTRYHCRAPSELPLEVRTLAEGKLLASFPANFSGSIAIAFSPDGRWLASADSDTEVRVIDTAKLALHARSTDLLVEPLSVVFSSDSSRLNVGTADGVLNVINPDNGKVAKR